MEGSELHRYYLNGTLEIDRKNWQAQDRENAGDALFELYYKAGFCIKCLDPSKIRVDITGYKATPESKAIAENLFRKAIRSVPKEFMSMINLVVLEDKKIAAKDRELVYLAKWRLCKGLDYLCEHFQSSRSHW